jgi:hypothetical protein
MKIVSNQISLVKKATIIMLYKDCTNIELQRVFTEVKKALSTSSNNIQIYKIKGVIIEKSL